MRGTPLLYLYLYLPSIQRPTFFLLDKFGCSGDNGFIYPSPKEFETSSSLLLTALWMWPVQELESLQILQFSEYVAPMGINVR
jgi:hypothetical protein